MNFVKRVQEQYSLYWKCDFLVLYQNVSFSGVAAADGNRHTTVNTSVLLLL